MKSTRTPAKTSSAGRRTQEQPGRSASARGASTQGELRKSKGGPAGANQGGAPRGGSRAEPSHTRTAMKKDQRGASPKARAKAPTRRGR